MSKEEVLEWLLVFLYGVMLFFIMYAWVMGAR